MAEPLHQQKEIRSGDLARRLREQRNRIIDLWTERVREQVRRAKRVPKPVLVDSLPAFLEQLADGLDPAESARMEIVGRMGEVHGEQRLNYWFDLNEVLLEYLVLRRVLFEILEEERPLKSSERDCLLDAVQNGTRHAANAYIRGQEELVRMFDALLSNHPDFIYLLDVKHRFTYVNRALLELWGKNLPEVRGKTFSELEYPADLVALHRSQLEKVIREKGPVRGRNPFTDRWGRTREYEYIFSPVFGEGGEVAGVSGVTRDITDSRSLEEELRRAIRERDDTLAFVSHDLRNPLGSIIMSATLLERKAPPGEEGEGVRRQAKRIQSAGLRMNHLIEDLLSLSRMGAGRLRINRRRESARDLLREVLEFALPQAQDKDIDFQVDRLEPDVFLSCDRGKLLRVLLNLVGNAIKFTPEGGLVCVGVSATDGMVTLYVRDTGPGIPRDHLEQIFERYWQAHETDARGAGLGLAIAKGIVEAHGGRIWVESDFGRGATFRLTIPRA